MKAGKPSSTAHFVALGRAIADAGLSHVPDFRDPTARVFLNERGKRSLAKLERQTREGKHGPGYKSARVMADIMALRTAAIDKAVRDAITAGATQLVILGAGYDGRAWRMSELRGVRVFEVDHPATQDDKRARVRQLPAPIGNVSFISIDFARDALDTVLDRAGHDRSSPTCWIWEGVVMYLTRDVMRATLASIAGRSAPGSTLIVNYHDAHRGLFARLMFWLIGEPQISFWSSDEMARDLKIAGFVVREDYGMADWNNQFAHGEAKVDRAPYMRIATAQRSLDQARQ
jgi:methyltransferase (TIGR00027 family)